MARPSVCMERTKQIIGVAVTLSKKRFLSGRICYMEKIQVTKAKVHNLKNVDVSLPRHSLTVITGPSGSGKSSLAFDTIYAEGQRRYIESLSSYARQFIGQF